MKNLNLILLLIATVAVAVAMRPSAAKLVTKHTPAGIINLELARTKTNVKNIMNLWRMKDTEKVDRIQAAKVNIYIDFLFIIAYSSFLFFATKQTSLQFYKRSTWAHWGKNLSLAAIIAGFLDILENAGMLLSLNNHISSGMVKFTFSVSLMKWIIVGVIISYLLVSFPLKSFQKKKMKPASA